LRVLAYMHVKVQHFSGSVLGIIDVQPCNKLEYIRQQILQIKGVQIGAFDLVHGTRLLCDNETVEDVDLHDGESILIVDREAPQVLTVSNHCILSLFEPESGECVRHFSGPSNEVMSAVFTPDGCKVLTVSRDGTAMVFDIEQNDPLQVMNQDQLGLSVFSPDGDRLVTLSSESDAQVFDVQTNTCQKVLKGCRIHDIIAKASFFSLDGSSILVVGIINELFIINIDSGNSVVLEDVKSAVFTPDGKSVLAVLCTGVVQRFDAISGVCLQEYDVDSLWMEFVACAPCGNKFVAVSSACAAAVVGVDKGNVICKIENLGYYMHPNTAVFAPDGESVLFALDSHKVMLFDAKSGEVICTMRGHVGVVNSAAFSKDGRYALTASNDDTAKVFSVPSGVCVSTMNVGGVVQSAVFS